METSQAIGYLETVTEAAISPRETSRAMFRLLRAAARIAKRAGVAEDSYYGNQKSPLVAWLFSKPVWSDIDPRSPRLQAAIDARFPIADPNGNMWALFGLEQ